MKIKELGKELSFVSKLISEFKNQKYASSVLEKYDCDFSAVEDFALLSEKDVRYLFEWKFMSTSALINELQQKGLTLGDHYVEPISVQKGMYTEYSGRRGCAYIGIVTEVVEHTFKFVFSLQDVLRPLNVVKRDYPKYSLSDGRFLSYRFRPFFTKECTESFIASMLEEREKQYKYISSLCRRKVRVKKELKILKSLTIL